MNDDWLKDATPERRKAVYDDVAAMIKKLQERSEAMPPWTMEDLERAKEEARQRRAASIHVTAKDKIK